MKKIISFLLNLMLVISCLNTGNVFAGDPVSYTTTFVFSGTTAKNKLVSLMIVDADADETYIRPEQIHKVAIVQADSEGKYSVTAELENAEYDLQTGSILNYKVLSNDTPECSIKDSPDIIVRFDDFSVTPHVENGILYVPIEEALQFIGGETLTYTYNADKRAYTGRANNGEFIIEMDKDTVEVDWVDIELPGRVKEIGGTNMMPAYAIKHILKTGDIIYKDGYKFFVVKDGIKEAGYDWDSSDIGSHLDQLIDANTRVVNDTALSIGSLWPHDPFPGDKTNWGSPYKDEKYDVVFPLTNNFDNGGTEVALQINASGDGNIPFENNHIGLVHFKARALYSADETGNASFAICLQRRAPSSGEILQFTTALNEQIDVPYIPGAENPEWIDYYFMADSGTTELLQYSWLKFIPLGKSSNVEICDIQFWDFGLRDNCADKIMLMKSQEGYKGVEKDHVWRQEAWNRIDKYRKEDIVISVVDEAGNPVSNAEIDVSMTENEFMFGGAQIEYEVLNPSETEKPYIDDFINNYTNAGVPADSLKAEMITETDGKVGINMVNEYLRRGKRVRGHTVLWDGSSLVPFDRYTEMTYDDIYNQMMDYVRSMATAYKGKLAQWDVINEMHQGHYLLDKFENISLYADIFKEIRKIDPDVKLYINETGIEGKRKKTEPDGYLPGLLTNVKKLKSAGAPIDGIGIQSHMSSYQYPQGFYHQLDECAKLVDEIAITEYDFYNGDTTYAPQQLEDTMLVAFSHPKTTAFIVWGIQDRLHWRGNANAAPFYDRQWNEKPAYQTWKRMVTQEFVTNEKIKTDDNGTAKIRAFRGDYDISCAVNGKQCKVGLGNVVDGGSSVCFTVLNSGNISANASNPKSIIVPSPDGGASSLSEAKLQYDEEFADDIEYKNMLLDHAFVNSAYNFIYGSDLGIPEYKQGKYWGSNTVDTKNLISTDDGISLTVKSDGVTTGTDAVPTNLVRYFQNHVKYADQGTSLYHELIFGTMNPSVSGSFEIECILSGYKIASLVYDSNRGYYIRKVDGSEIALSNDAWYTLKIGYVPNDSGNYDLTYEVKESREENGSNLCQEIVFSEQTRCAVNWMLNLNDINSLSYLLLRDCTAGEIFKLNNSRVYEYKQGELLEFGNVKNDAMLLEESMKDFNVWRIPVSSLPDSAPEDWTIVGYGSSSRSQFDYTGNGMYLYTKRAQPNGVSKLIKGFNSVKYAEEVTLSFDMYLNAGTSGVDSTENSIISLESISGDKSLEVINFRPTTGWAELYALNGEKIMDFPWDPNDPQYSNNFKWNQKRITAKLVLSPNEEDPSYYDSVMSFNSKTEDLVMLDGTTTLIKEKLISAEDLMKLDVISISDETDQSGYNGNNDGKMILGVRNISLKKMGNELSYENGEIVISDSSKHDLSLSYTNDTGAYRDVLLCVGGYDANGALVNSFIKNYTMKRGNGLLSFDFDTSNDKVQYYKVFAWDGLKTLTPYKSADYIRLK